MNKILARFKGVKIDAYKLLNYLRIAYDFEVKPPIDVDKIARLLGVEISEDPFEGSWADVGHICVDRKGIRIWINPFENMNEKRRRFTLAHELGHLVLHILQDSDFQKENICIKDNKKTFKRNNFWDIREYQANTFAAQLLMPASLFTKEFERLSTLPLSKEQIIEKLSDIFQVSKQAVEFRLKNLRLL